MCKECDKKPVYEFTNQRKLCKNCFIHWFDKKFLYTLRKFEMIKSGDIIGYENKGDFRGVVLEENLKQFSNNQRTQTIKLPTKKKYNKIALSSSLDQESYIFVQSLIENKTNKLKEISPVNKNKIRPLFLFLDKEIKLYANLRGLKYKETKEKKKEWETFIDKLEESHPEIKQAIMQSYLKIFE